MKKCLLVVPLFFVFSLQAQVQKPEVDTIKKAESKKFELTFGQQLLFISNTKLEQIRTDESVILPTSSILFLVELRPSKRLRIPVFFNLPTESKQFLVNNQLVNEKASSAFGTGIEYCFLKAKISSKSHFELEAGPVATFLITDAGLRCAPVVAGRVRFIKNSDFVIYLGSSYTYGIFSWGLLYGTGYIF